MNFIFLYCRPGFENECAAEIQDVAATLNIQGYCKAKEKASYASFHPHQPDDALQLIESLPFKKLIFTRQWFMAVNLISTLPVNDRVTPLLNTIKPHINSFKEIVYEHLDTNDGKALSALCKSFANPFNKALVKNVNCKLTEKGAQRIHICFLSSTAAAIGYSYINNSAPWPMGIPRLRLAKNAPSRSALKLDEAMLSFFSRDKVNSYFQSGMKAVDLGAAPGGWTWQLVKYNMYVTAIDNGPMNADLMDTGLVTHKKHDAFYYKPESTVDWMVCDIVDKPSKVANLMQTWLVNQWCKKTIFNLKLPMKKRYAEVTKILNELNSALSEQNIKYSLICKQLYHDREEVTVFIETL